jgi:hypothetical protein
MQGTADRLIFLTDMQPTCCAGAVFLPDEVIENVPSEILSKNVTAEEWIKCMRSIQSVTLGDTPTFCCQMTAAWCCGLIGLLCIRMEKDSLKKNLHKSIQHFNKTVFKPRGLYISIQTFDANCCDEGTTALVIALSPESSAILALEPGIH